MKFGIGHAGRAINEVTFAGALAEYFAAYDWGPPRLTAYPVNLRWSSAPFNVIIRVIKWRRAPAENIKKHFILSVVQSFETTRVLILPNFKISHNLEFSRTVFEFEVPLISSKHL
jgi:hypothetical protein